MPYPTQITLFTTFKTKQIMFRIETIGNLGGDAEIKNDNGRQYVQFSVADTRRYKKEDGTEVETTNWISCFYRNVDSEVVKYLKKGTRVFVRGNGETRLFSSQKDRMMKAGVSINVSEIELVGGGSSDPVPTTLYLPTGQMIPVYKFFYIDNNQMAEKPTVLYDRKGQPYEVAPNGFITPPPQPAQQPTSDEQANSPQQQQAAPQQQHAQASGQSGSQTQVANGSQGNNTQQQPEIW